MIRAAPASHRSPAAMVARNLARRAIVCQKRHRTTFNQYQLGVLEEAFEQNNYPTPTFRQALAGKTNLDKSRVQVWFQNRRAKHKKQVSQAMRCFAADQAHRVSVANNTFLGGQQAYQSLFGASLGARSPGRLERPTSCLMQLRQQQQQTALDLHQNPVNSMNAYHQQQPFVDQTGNLYASTNQLQLDFQCQLNLCDLQLNADEQLVYNQHWLASSANLSQQPQCNQAAELTGLGPQVSLQQSDTRYPSSCTSSPGSTSCSSASVFSSPATSFGLTANQPQQHLLNGPQAQSCYLLGQPNSTVAGQSAPINRHPLFTICSQEQDLQLQQQQQQQQQQQTQQLQNHQQQQMTQQSADFYQQLSTGQLDLSAGLPLALSNSLCSPTGPTNSSSTGPSQSRHTMGSAALAVATHCNTALAADSAVLMGQSAQAAQCSRSTSVAMPLLSATAAANLQQLYQQQHQQHQQRQQHQMSTIKLETSQTPNVNNSPIGHENIHSSPCGSYSCKHTGPLPRSSAASLYLS